jgi:hypothetical protein
MDKYLPSKTEGLLLAVSLLLGGALIWQKNKSDSYCKSYWSERRGRVRVEKEISKLTKVQLDTSDGFYV